MQNEWLYGYLGSPVSAADASVTRPQKEGLAKALGLHASAEAMVSAVELAESTSATDVSLAVRTAEHLLANLRAYASASHEKRAIYVVFVDSQGLFGI